MVLVRTVQTFFTLKQRIQTLLAFQGRGALQNAKSQIRVVAIFFIRRVLFAAIGAKFILRTAVEFPAALLAYRHRRVVAVALFVSHGGKDVVLTPTFCPTTD
jgi:hypothetical protein